MSGVGLVGRQIIPRKIGPTQTNNTPSNQFKEAFEGRRFRQRSGSATEGGAVDGLQRREGER